MRMPFISLLFALLTLTGPARAATVDDLALRGEIDGENIVFTLTLTAEGISDGETLDLVHGDVAYLDGEFPAGAQLERTGNGYQLKLGATGWGRRTGAVTFRFASRPDKDGEWRRTAFNIPLATVRTLAVVCDRPDLDVRFPGALNLARTVNADGKTEVTANLGLTGAFEILWKPEVRKLDAELTMTCDANMIAIADIGVLRMDTIFTFRVIQGRLNTLHIDLPAVNVTQVHGDDIQGWNIEPGGGTNATQLVVRLSRPYEETAYRLHVQTEMALPEFPCSFDLPGLSPRNAIRTSGFVMVGTDSAIKLTVERAAGLTQVDQTAFPAMALADHQPRHTPARSAYAYQYANASYTLGIKATDIVPAFSADGLLTVALDDDELVMNAAIELDIKDAPLRDVTLTTDATAGWTVTAVSGQHVAEPDTDVLDAGNAGRSILVPFKQALLGTTLLRVRMERTLPATETRFAVPVLRVDNARSQRGYVVLAAEEGVRIKAAEPQALREVHTGSVPVQTPGAQQAFRFKDGNWSLAAEIERTHAALHSESFHLVSLGEGVMYCSAAISYHISGAPVQQLLLEIPEEIRTFEITGADIESWSREGARCAIRLQTRISGDYTLLVTYDQQFAAEGDVIHAGGIRTLGTESDAGYIVAASAASLRIEPAGERPDAIIDIEPEELPRAYATPITDPIIASYKYVRAPHQLALRLVPIATEPLLGQNADYVNMQTTFTADGEAVTRALYYIKNANRQYLVFALPANAELWTVRYVNDDGTPGDALSQHNDGRYLVPLKRPRDPNAALQVEVTFAQSHGELGFWRSGVRPLRMQAPHLPETHATFATWELTVPEGFTIAAAEGDMIADDANPAAAGLAGLGRTILGSLRAVMDGPGGRTLSEYLTRTGAWPTTRRFTRAVGLSDEAPVVLRVVVVPGWVGAHGSPHRLVGALAGILVLLWVRFTTQKGRPAVLAGIATLLLAALAATDVTCRVSAAAISLAIAVPVLFWLFRRLLRLIRWIGAGCRAGWRRVAARRHARRQAAAPAPLDPATDPLCPFAPSANAASAVPPPPATAPDQGGFMAVRMCLLTLTGALATLLLLSPARGDAPVAELPGGPVMEQVEIRVAGPASDAGAEQSALITTRLIFTLAEAARIPLVPPQGVLLSATAPERHTRIDAGTDGYSLDAQRKGSYDISVTYRLPVQTTSNGIRELRLPVPPNMRNRLDVALPEPGMEIQCPEAVVFRARDDEKTSAAEVVYGPVREARITWRPRLRLTRLEDAVFFCEVNSYAALRPGVMEVNNIVRFQPAQGEIKALRLDIPAGMNVTAVHAEGLATWSFNPETRRLDAILEAPVHRDVLLRVVTQLPCDGLPYKATLGAITVQGAARQRGAITVGAPDSVQVRVGDTLGVSPMNLEDFPAAIPDGKTGCQVAVPDSIGRRAFRYHDPAGVRIPVETERILPELRLDEQSALSIGDERIVLSSQLTLGIAKSGIFTATLAIPEGFEVEALSGPDINHWDDSRGTNRQVVIHFARQVSDKTQVNLVLACMKRGIEEQLTVPRVRLDGASKHTGRLVVSGERGVRLIIGKHHGVDVRKASEEGVNQPGVLVFNLLRPNWEIALRTEVMAPQVKPDILQRVDLSEGMLLCTAYIRYRIENAGVKQFLLQAPAPGLTLSVIGRDIARVHCVDPSNGVWQVDLHSKRQQDYPMTVSYQQSYDPAGQRVVVRPLRTLETEDQRGYLAVFCGGRVQVRPTRVSDGLKVEDARTIPSDFGAGDLSDAVQCYRMLKSAPELELSVVRHDAADVLPASIEQASLLSVVSSSHRMLTRVQLHMRVGNHRFLEIRLPHPDDHLWTAQVNGREVAVAREQDCFLLPLERQHGDAGTDVEIIYAGTAERLFRHGQRFRAPRFGLPLNNIQWQMYVRPDRQYQGFDGNMTLVADEQPVVAAFDAGRYRARNQEQRNDCLAKARRILTAGAQLVQGGRQEEAKKAFQQALSYSQAQADLNEDARVQLRNLQKQQVKFGLLNRRDNIRFNNNAASEQEIAQIEAFNDGNFTQDYAQHAEQQLSAKERDALDLVADKIIDQQAAAAGVVSAIRVTVPEHGQLLQFRRALLNDRDAELWVAFRDDTGRAGRMVRQYWPAAMLFLLLWAVTSRRPRRQV